MRDNTRRNRNIGTAKQGHGLKNKMKISEPIYNGDYRSFYERLDNYTKQKRIINGHEFHFIVESLNKDSFHACSVDDIAKMLQYIPTNDYGDLKFIVLRQPKRKEKIITPVWGRLIYSYEFENEYCPAIILESISENDRLRWTKRLSVAASLEFERLKLDGYKFIEHKRFFEAEMQPNLVRNTQLYRTLLHEFGHYAHYLEIVTRPAIEDEEFEEREKRQNYYFESILSTEKEKFAHNYADKLKANLYDQKLIPFDYMGDKEDII